MRFRAAVPALVGLAMLSGAVWHVLGQPARVAVPPAHQANASSMGLHVGAHAGPHSGMTGGMPGGMTEVDMQRWAESWWASHPRVGAMSTQPPIATVTVRDFIFDHDNNLGTQVDEVNIDQGQSVKWQWINGVHTITNGVDGADPQAGTLFDQPSDLGTQQFTFTFNTAGRFPYFCRFHELNVMKGVVVVSGTTGVGPFAGRALGFTSDPAPNPTRSGVSFDFALREPGRARAEVFDSRGRRIAVVLDRDLEGGPHAAAWDGRTASGANAGAGLYYLRLRLPGYSGSRAIVIRP